MRPMTTCVHGVPSASCGGAGHASTLLPWGSTRGPPGSGAWLLQGPAQLAGATGQCPTHALSGIWNFPSPKASILSDGVAVPGSVSCRSTDQPQLFSWHTARAVLLPSAIFDQPAPMMIGLGHEALTRPVTAHAVKFSASSAFTASGSYTR